MGFHGNFEVVGDSVDADNWGDLDYTSFYARSDRLICKEVENNFSLAR